MTTTHYHHKGSMRRMRNKSLEKPEVYNLRV